MKRRTFLSLMGIAPIAAYIKSAVAEPVASTDCSYMTCVFRDVLVDGVVEKRIQFELYTDTHGLLKNSIDPTGAVATYFTDEDGNPRLAWIR